jgi:hypothetical protein
MAEAPAVRRELIVGCLESLDQRIRRALDDSEWTVEATLHANPFERYGTFLVTKKRWARRYKVGLSAEKTGGRGFIIGVTKIEGLAPVPDLKLTLDEYIRPGLHSASWDWYHYLDPPYADWDNKTILLAMYDGFAAEYLDNYLQRIVSQAVPLIDKHLSSGGV